MSKAAFILLSIKASGQLHIWVYNTDICVDIEILVG